MNLYIMYKKPGCWRYIKPFLPLKNGTLFDFFFSQMTKT